MKFFKNRTVALILCLIVVIGSTLLNTSWKLGGQCRDLYEEFYGWGGIAPWLETLHTESENLAVLAEANGIDTRALRAASNELQTTLSQRNVSAARLYSCYDALRTQLRITEQQLLSAQLNEKDAAAVSQCLETIHAAQTAVSASDYNARVRSFRARNGSLFTRILASLAGVKMPEEFA